MSNKPIKSNLTFRQSINLPKGLLWKSTLDWLIDLIHRRKNCPMGMISGWVQKVTEHRGTNSTMSIFVQKKWKNVTTYSTTLSWWAFSLLQSSATSSSRTVSAAISGRPRGAWGRCVWSRRDPSDKLWKRIFSRKKTGRTAWMGSVRSGGLDAFGIEKWKILTVKIWFG